jgi:hypothetical protein
MFDKADKSGDEGVFDHQEWKKPLGACRLTASADANHDVPAAKAPPRSSSQDEQLHDEEGMPGWLGPISHRIDDLTKRLRREREQARGPREGERERERASKGDRRETARARIVAPIGSWVRFSDAGVRFSEKLVARETRRVPSFWARVRFSGWGKRK